MSRIALVTGANKGIGFETARQLAQKGYTVLLGARDKGRGETAAATLRDEGLDAALLLLDVLDEASIKRAVDEVERRFGVLDVLINNAGRSVAADKTSPSQVPLSAFRDVYALNVFAVHEVTTAFWPLLNKSSGARLVNVSSALGSLSIHANGGFEHFKPIAYDSSKAALNMMTLHYAHEWKDTPHRANTIHPGSVQTDMNPGGELTVEDGAKTSVALATIGADGPNGGFFHMGETLPW